MDAGGGRAARSTRKTCRTNAAYDYNLKPGASGKLVLEFWITPFDYAGCDGPERAIESQLMENKLIGLSWCLIDYDDVNAKGRVGFWNLSHKQTFFGNADQLVGFRLMPLEPPLVKGLQTKWTRTVVDMSRRLVAFRDQSVGTVTSWKWDFGDGGTSIEQHPQHAYMRGGDFVVTLEVAGPEGTSRFQRVWDVSLR